MELCNACGTMFFTLQECPICHPKPKHLNLKQPKSQQAQKEKNIMGFNTILTPEDLKKGDLVPPGWYTAKIVNYEEKEASTDKSTNLIFHLEIQDEKYKGITPTFRLNEKALGFGTSLWKALDFPFYP